MEVIDLLKPKSVENVKNIEGHSGAIYDIICFEGSLFTASADKFVAQWDIAEGKQTDFAVKLDYSSYCLAYSPKTNLLAIGGNTGAIHVVDIARREEVRMLTQHKASVFSLSYNPIKGHFYSGDRNGYFCVWDSETFDLLLTLPVECGKIRKVAMSENGEQIAICGQDGWIRILETEYFNQLVEFDAHKDGANCALFDGDHLYSGGKDAHIRKWNWKEKQMLREIPGHNYAVYDIDFLDNKTKIVTVSFDKTIKLWDTETLSIIERIEYKNGGHRHVVNRIAKISEQEFATVSDDKKIKIWKLKA